MGYQCGGRMEMTKGRGPSVRIHMIRIILVVDWLAGLSSSCWRAWSQLPMRTRVSQHIVRPILQIPDTAPSVWLSCGCLFASQKMSPGSSPLTVNSSDRDFSERVINAIVQSNEWEDGLRDQSSVCDETVGYEPGLGRKRECVYALIRVTSVGWK